MKNSEIIRNSTPNHNVIFWDGVEMETRLSGAINSKGGILLQAFIPEINKWVEHRSNDAHGYKGFSFGDGKPLPVDIRKRMEFKY